MTRRLAPDLVAFVDVWSAAERAQTDGGCADAAGAPPPPTKETTR